MNNNRIAIVDALRGFALLLIVLIHYVEHFDFFFAPEKHFIFSAETDGKVMEWVFFFISGKAYSIFALLFGFSFFIQMSRKSAAGVDFRWGFLWRLTVLFILGMIHSFIYKGDILHIYALLGTILLILYKVNTKALWVIAVLLFLQISLFYQLIRSFSDPRYIYEQSFGSGYWEEGNNAYAFGSFYDVLAYNFWKGRTTVLGWTFYNGRYLQLPALFIVGFILGRKKVFEKISNYKKQLYIILSISFILLIGFGQLAARIGNFGFNNQQTNILGTITGSYSSLAFTSVIITAIILIYIRFKNVFVFSLFASYGKMSLTNYVSQAVFGVLFFYGFGLGMYRYMGSSWSVLIGAFVFIIQAFISKYWAIRFYYGPLEWFWRAMTFFNFKTKFRKKEGPASPMKVVV